MAEYPNKRIGFITGARWDGPDNRLMLSFDYFTNDECTTKRTFVLQAGVDICLPAAKGINDIEEDGLISLLRMATLISRLLPPSVEWSDKFIDASPAWVFKTSVGEIEANTATTPSDGLVDIEFEEAPGGTKNGNKRTISLDVATLREYNFDPKFQMNVIAGSLRTEYGTSSHVHDLENETYLTDTEKSDQITYLEALEIWI